MTVKRLFGISGIYMILVLVSAQGCEKSEPGDGFLSGVITIGPLCPVETIPPSPACQPTAETYIAYPVGVYSTDGEDRIAELEPALDGSFTTGLHPGKYLLILDKSPEYLGKCNLPARITITERDTTRYDINIDTGIR
jgi:hypothetical protein